MSLRSAALSLSLLGSAHGLAVGPAPVRAATQSTVAGSQPSMPSLGRRAALLGAASAALLPLAAHANTQAQFDAPQSGFEEGAEKRKRFLEKQKVFKKKWRKNLAELEFASNDDEAMTAINALIGLIQENGMEIPEGVRKQDMDQVYRTVQDKLAKPTRMNFKKLDAIVQQIVTVKSMGVDFDP